MIIEESEEIKKYIERYLRDYQAEAVRNIINIYNRSEHNRFASVVLPTGAGKSFVVMAILQMINVTDFVAEGFDVRKPRNTTKMLYVAPTKDILLQIKMHIINNIYLPNAKGIDASDLSIEDINRIVDNLFPNIVFRCYAGVKGEQDENDQDILSEQDVEGAELIILDEAHRSGAEKWSERIERVVRRNDSKILAISATPERNDTEGKEMMAGIAKMCYPDEVISPDVYMAQEIYILDAMRDGLINVPKVINSNVYLYYSSEYVDVLNRWREEKDPQLKEELGSILDQMEDIIGIRSNEFEDREIPEDIIRQARIQETNRLIKSELDSDDPVGKMSPNDKAIVFIPNRESSNEELQEYFQQYIDEIKQYYNGVIDPRTGKQIEVIPHIISGKNDDKENERNLSEFERASESLPGIHILITQNKGAEGLHIEGGKIVYDLRGGDSTNVALQRVGRVISSLDPKKPLSEHGKTRFFDIKGCLFKQAAKGIGRKNSIQYDIYRLKQISEWIIEHKRYPDINAGLDDFNGKIDSHQQIEYEREARMAYAIKQYQILVTRYRNGYEFEPGQADKIIEFIELINNMPQFGNNSFMSVQIGERTKIPLESDLVGKDFLLTTPEQDRFLQLSLEAMQLGRKSEIPNKSRIDKLMHILQIISIHKPNLTLPGGIITRESVYEWWNHGSKTREIESTVGGLNLDLKDFLKANFSQDEIKEIMVELKNADTKQISYRGEEYDFGSELAYVRGLFFTAGKDSIDIKHSPFENYDIKAILHSGLIDFKRCPELKTDIHNMFGLEVEDYLDYIGSNRITFKKAKDIKKHKRDNEQRYNEKNERKRKPPYSNKAFGVLDKFSGISLITGERVMTREELKRHQEEQKIAQFEEALVEQRKQAQAIERQKAKEAAALRKARKKARHADIASNPTNYFTQTKYGYAFHHELRYGPKKAEQILFSFDEECDEQGFILEENPDTGDLEYHLLKDIEITRFVMTQMIDFGKSFDEVCLEYMENENRNNVNNPITIDDAISDICFFIENTVGLYEKIPTILDLQQDGSGKLIFSGVDELLYSRGDDQKRSHIDEFLKTVKELIGIDFVEIRKNVMSKDKNMIEILTRESERRSRRGERLDDDQQDLLFNAQVRRKKSFTNYLDDDSR